MKLNINDEQGIELLYFIFERELKPPFRKGEIDGDGDYEYFNRDGDIIGWLNPDRYFSMKHDPFCDDIRDKVCNVFEFSYDTPYWWSAIKPYLKSWMEGQINIKLNDIFF